MNIKIQVNNMRILFFTRLYWPHVGGAENHVRGRNKLLLKKGFKLTTVTDKYDKDLPEKEAIERKTVVTILSFR